MPLKLSPAQRHRRRLLAVDFTQEQIAPVMEQIGDTIGFHVESLDPRKPLADQMKALALDCYLQGLLDGQQVQPKGATSG